MLTFPKAAPYGAAFVIAHRMRTVSGADKIVVLSDGKMAEQCTPQKLMDKGGIFAGMSELQRQSGRWAI